MGLDVSHGCWRGAYSAFMRWRCHIADALDMPPLMLMEGFYHKEDPYHVMNYAAARMKEPTSSARLARGRQPGNVCHQVPAHPMGNSQA